MFSNNYENFSFIRYPGGKGRFLKYLIPYLPEKKKIRNKYVEPFVGSGAVFFALNPKKAILSDINHELIELYEGIKRNPKGVWSFYSNFPKNKKGYYKIRDSEINNSDITFRAARLLYLNRTCFKGMWRHNSKGNFNIGYGGQDRRWVIEENDLIEISKRLSKTKLKCSDFETVINLTKKGDFMFVDPPYKPGKKEMTHAHFTFGEFSFAEQKRLCKTLKEATNKGVHWAMTNSSHPDIISLYDDVSYHLYQLIKGTGSKPGIVTNNVKEILICNY